MVGIEFEFYEVVYIWIIKEDRGFCSVISLMYVLIFLLELKIWSEYGKKIYIYIFGNYYFLLLFVFGLFLLLNYCFV